MEDATYVAEIFEDVAGGFRWRLIAANGRIVGTSGEAYVRRSHAEGMAESIFGGADRVTLRVAD